MKRYELYIEPRRLERNPHNGQYLKGHTAYNKGRSMAEYMTPEKLRRWKRNIVRNLEGHRPIGACARPVFMLDGEGRTVAWFPSAKAASEKTGISTASISQAINGVHHTAGGYRWIKDKKR